MSTKLTFEDFLADVAERQKAAVTKIHDDMTASGYKHAVEKKASGALISYKHPKTKHSVFNLFFRKDGLQARIYAENHRAYADFIAALPDFIEAQVNKASQCGRFMSPPKCSDKCMGYDILINGNRYQKCRYSCFHLKADEKSLPIIVDLIEREKTARG